MEKRNRIIRLVVACYLVAGVSLVPSIRGVRAWRHALTSPVGPHTQSSPPPFM